MKTSRFQRLAAYAAAAALAFALCAFALVAIAQPQQAYADEKPIGTVQCFMDAEGTKPIDSEGPYPIASESLLIEALESYSKLGVKSITITMSKDWYTKDAGRIVIEEGLTLRLKMNGHMINRDKYEFDSDGAVGHGSGEVIHMKKNSKLYVDGGTKDTSHVGFLKKTSYRFQGEYNIWQPSDEPATSAGAVVINGGVIAGGFCDDKTGGGGISTEGEGVTIELKDVTVAGNFSDEYGLLYGNGGGVAIHGKNSTLVLDHANVSYNGSDSCGAGIYVREKDCSVTVKNGSSVDHNYAVSDGGGIYIDEDSTPLTIEGSSVSDNRTRYDGGGIYMDGKGKLTVKGSTFKGNKAADNGGAICVAVACEFLVDDCELTENAANDGGGAIMHKASNGAFTIKNSKLLSNSTGGFGGAIADWYDGTTINISGCTINKNYTWYNSAATDVDDHGGGAIHLEDKATLNVENSEIRDNTSSYTGGGINVTDPSTINLDNCSIRGNRTTSYVGGGGGIAFCPNSTIGSAGEMYLNLKNKTSICYNIADGIGGGIYGYRNSVNVKGDGTCTIIGNHADRTGAGIGFTSESAMTQKITVDNVKITENRAHSDGGGIHINRSECVLKDVEITLNKSDNCNGAGLYVSSDKYYALTFQGKVVIDRNNVVRWDGWENVANTYLDNADQTVCGGDGDNALSADSRIGIYAATNDSADRKLSGNGAFLQNFKNLSDSEFAQAFYSDQASHKVVRKDGHLYLKTLGDDRLDEAWALNAVVNGHTQTTNYTVDKRLTLNSADYADYVPEGKVIVGWKIESSDGTSSYLRATGGKVTFRKPPCVTTATAVFGDKVTKVKASLLDACGTWKELGNNNKKVKLTLLEVSTAKGTFTIPASVVASKVNIPNADEDKTACNETSRKATYKFRVDPSLFDDYGMGVADVSDLEHDVDVSTLGFGEGTVEEVKFQANPSTMEVAVTVTYTKPVEEAKAKVTCVNKNDNSADAISYAETSFSTEGDTEVVAPSLEGWAFDSWGDLPEGATLNEDGQSVTVAKADTSVELKANYIPKASALAVQVTVPTSAELASESKLESCKLVDSAQIQDVTDEANDDVDVEWKEAEGGSKLVAITMKLDQSKLGCLIDGSSMSGAVNGVAGSVSVDEDKGTQTVTATIPAESDKRLDALVTSLDDVTLYGSEELESYADNYLPDTVSYRTKSGYVTSANVKWKTGDVDTTQDSFTVEGSFTDASFATHKISRSFKVEDKLEAPSVSTQGGIHESTTVGFRQASSWGNPSSIDYHYYVGGKDDEADKISLDTYKAGESVDIDKSCKLFVYATLTYKSEEEGVADRTVTTAVASYEYTLRTVHELTVTGGTAHVSGTGNKAASSANTGDEVTIKAQVPEGKKFDKWVVVKGDVTLDSELRTKTKFEMPDSDVEIKATFIDPESDDATPTPAPVVSKVSSVKYQGNTYTLSGKVLKLTKVAKSKKKVTIPAKLKINGSYVKVAKVKAKVFKGTKVKTVIVKSGNLTKKGLKNCLKSSKVKTVKVKVSKSKKANAKQVKKYRKYLKKSNSGKKVTVRRG